MSDLAQLREVAGRPLCPSMTQDGIRHVARNVDFIECSCEPECPDDPWWDRYRTADDLLAMHRALPALLDVAEAAQRIRGLVVGRDGLDDHLGEAIEAALDRLREVSS